MREAFMPNKADLEVLKAVMAVAAADGNITRAERGVFKTLAGRLGIPQADLDRMIDDIQLDPTTVQKLFATRIADAEEAMKLLVATARIDGQIDDNERKLLVEISSRLGIAVNRFSQVYQAGIAAADAMRKRRGV
jgi:tellurite resistance protein